MRRRFLLLLALTFPAALLAAPSAVPRPTARPTVGRAAVAYTLPPEKYRQAIAYSRAKYRLHFIGFAWEVVLLGGLVALRVGPRYRDLAERISRRPLVQALVFVPLLLATAQVLDLPLAARGHRLSVLYGQSIQGWGSWLWDWLKAGLIALVLLVPVVWVLYGILRRSPRRWWLWFWLATLPIIVLVVFIAPVVVDPLFFEFQPLAGKAPELVEKIEKVTERGGLSIPRDRMFLMNASEKLKSVNAYVTGFGASKRVVVWDTTLDRMTVPQALFVFGHEMGHYVLAHIPKTIAFVAGLLLVLLILAYVLLRRVLPAGREYRGIRGIT
ncbi:MAG TPA: M48 family metalloprotease, partial [Thermoanaerobaculia bacterium]|nr:M48 family metalloprotease [Thermoanaerobaculia bacterium]